MSGVDLPPGLTSRPLTLADAEAVAAVMAAQELADLGVAQIEAADLVADWRAPSFPLAESTLGLLADGAIVAYGDVSGGERGDAAVHPDHRGRGLGTALAHWMQARGRALGLTRVGMPVPAGSPGERLLLALGYRVWWTSWTLALPPGRAIPERPLPAGYAVRAAHPDEYAVLHDVLEDAFLEWADRSRESYAAFLAHTVERPGFAPWLLRVVVGPAGAVVGGVVLVLARPAEDLEGYVDRVAVRRDQRGRGLAQALLADAFAVTRAHGAVRSTLATDSRTGALGLYTRVGMVADSTWVHLAVDL